MTQPLKETSLLDEVTPKKIVPRKATTPSINATAYNRKLAQKSLTNLYEAAGYALLPFDPQCAAIFADEDFVAGAVESWLDLADTSPFFKKMLTRLITTTGWGKVITAHMPLAMAVLSHHTDFGKNMALLASGRVPDGNNQDS